MLPTITIDIGTTSIKLSLYDADGLCVTSQRHLTPTRDDAWGDVYDIDVLVSTVTSFIEGLDQAWRATVRRIAITGVGESGGLVRPDLSLASPLILWHDHRGSDRLKALSPDDIASIYRITGLPANPNYALPKVAWALEHAAGPRDDLQWLNVSEYLAAVMTGQRWSEPSLASRTLALDLKTRTWSTEVTSLFDVDPSVFPPLRPASDGVALRQGFALLTGLPTDVEVHVAGHDHMVGAVGAGLRRDELLNSTGTTEGLLFLRQGPTLDDWAGRAKLANGLACQGESFTLFASIPTGGAAFATLQSLLGLDAAALNTRINDLDTRYRNGRINLDHLPLVLPQFRGSPPPDKDNFASGAISGLRAHTTADDLIMGCFLGMVLQFSDVLGLFSASPERIKVIGPASGNRLWLQLKADLLDCPLDVSVSPEVVSRGAQCLASGTTGRWEDLSTYQIAPSTKRGASLREWAEAALPQWSHMRRMPR